MNKSSSLVRIVGFCLQIAGGMVAFLLSLIIANMLFPLSAEIMAAAPPSGFLSTPLAFVFNGAVNALILVWAGRCSSFRGLAMAGQLFVLSFGAQVFQTQVESGYFIAAFPLLHNNFELYALVARGLVTSLLISLLVTLMVGGFANQPRPQTAHTVALGVCVENVAWLAAVYVVLYMLFGYFVAWQVKDVRLFYGGPAVLNGFFEQWGLTLMQKPELPVFQYFRGILWLLCLAPLFIGFSGKRVELVILSALALALLPTAQLSFANPLMPAAVSLGHFWEVAISTGIMGALFAAFIPKAMRSAPGGIL